MGGHNIIHQTWEGYSIKILIRRGSNNEHSNPLHSYAPQPNPKQIHAKFQAKKFLLKAGERKNRSPGLLFAFAAMSNQFTIIFINNLLKKLCHQSEHVIILGLAQKSWTNGTTLQSEGSLYICFQYIFVITGVQ